MSVLGLLQRIKRGSSFFASWGHPLGHHGRPSRPPGAPAIIPGPPQSALAGKPSLVWRALQANEKQSSLWRHLGPKFSFWLRNCQNRAGRRRLTLRYEYRCGQHRSIASKVLFFTCSWYFGHHCLGFRAGTAHFRATAHRHPKSTSIPQRLHLEAAEANASFSPMSTGRSSRPPFRGAQVARHRRCCSVCGIRQLSNLTQPVAVVPTLHVGARWSREEGFIHHLP